MISSNSLYSLSSSTFTRVCMKYPLPNGSVYLFNASLANVYNQIRKQEIAHAIAKKHAKGEINELIRTDKQNRVELINGDFQDKQLSFPEIVLI
jgi:hypothetical protein